MIFPVRIVQCHFSLSVVQSAFTVGVVQSDCCLCCPIRLYTMLSNQIVYCVVQSDFIPCCPLRLYTMLFSQIVYYFVQSDFIPCCPLRLYTMLSTQIVYYVVQSDFRLDRLTLHSVLSNQIAGLPSSVVSVLAGLVYLSVSMTRPAPFTRRCPIRLQGWWPAWSVCWRGWCTCRSA